MPRKRRPASSRRCTRRPLRRCRTRRTNSITSCRPNSSRTCSARIASTARATGAKASQDLADAEDEALAHHLRTRASSPMGSRSSSSAAAGARSRLYMAERFPNASIVAVSNSAPQREYILARHVRRGLKNVEVITCDMNDLRRSSGASIASSRSRCSSTCATTRALFESVRDWLVPEGKFFMHIFVHRAVPYAFEDRDADDWMSRHFFSGGMMPSAALPLHFQDHLRLRAPVDLERHALREDCERLAGESRRAPRRRCCPSWRATYGRDSADVWLQRWRIFFMACAELWGFRAGQRVVGQPLSVPAAAGVKS